jgi:hypothetical protein
MTRALHLGGDRYGRLLWIAIAVIALVTFLIDALGWFRDGWLLAP